MHLSLAQLRSRLSLAHERRMAICSTVALCVAVTLVLIMLLDTLYFWIPNVLISTALLSRAKP